MYACVYEVAGDLKMRNGSVRCDQTMALSSIDPKVCAMQRQCDSERASMYNTIME